MLSRRNRLIVSLIVATTFVLFLARSSDLTPLYNTAADRRPQPEEWLAQHKDTDSGTGTGTETAHTSLAGVGPAPKPSDQPPLPLPESSDVEPAIDSAGEGEPAQVPDTDADPTATDPGSATEGDAKDSAQVSAPSALPSATGGGVNLIDIVDEEDIDWSRFAYTQYVTNSDYLCNSVMIFETLFRLGAKADRVMMYPARMLRDITATESKSMLGQLIIKARDEYKVKLVPIQVQHSEVEHEDDTWADSYTKLLAFNQTQYDRVLALDSDSVVLQTMDELFLLPPCPVAMPRAYWLIHDDPPRRILSSQLILLQPDATEFERIVEKTFAAGPNDYDMEIVNDLYLDSATILPHRRYDLLTAEFRSQDHALYLGSEREQWDPVAVLDEAKFVHFSDWPVPKPWIPMDGSMRNQKQPDCVKDETGRDSCTEREIWNGFYNDFLVHRKEVCGRDFMPDGEDEEGEAEEGEA